MSVEKQQQTFSKRCLAEKSEVDGWCVEEEEESEEKTTGTDEEKMNR